MLSPATTFSTLEIWMLFVQVTAIGISIKALSPVLTQSSPWFLSNSESSPLEQSSIWMLYLFWSCSELTSHGWFEKGQQSTLNGFLLLRKKPDRELKALPIASVAWHGQKACNCSGCHGKVHVAGVYLVEVGDGTDPGKWIYFCRRENFAPAQRPVVALIIKANQFCDVICSLSKSRSQGHLSLSDGKVLAREKHRCTAKTHFSRFSVIQRGFQFRLKPFDYNTYKTI